MNVKTKTKSEQEAGNVSALLRARNCLIWIVSTEESRTERWLFEAAARANYIPRTWDTAQGVADMGGRVDVSLGSPDVAATLTMIGERAKRGDALLSSSLSDSERERLTAQCERGVWIMRDLPIWLNGLPMAQTLRQVRNLARSLPSAARESAQAIIVLSPTGDVPPELIGHATVINWPLPDRAEIESILDAAIESLPDEMQAGAAPNGQREAAIDAAIGLSGEQAQACYARSLVQMRRIDPVAVATEKKRVISREKVLEWIDPLKDGLSAIGGLDALKTWLVARSVAYTPAAREYGLPSPKGILLVGVPGCGKSLTAKAVGTAWQAPLLRADLGALKSKFVGESEQNLRKAFSTIEAVGRCVVWLDEIEKALAGSTQGAADGGVSADALGAILSWMQDRRGEAFVIATCNDIEKLPSELLRKGRFDEIWFVDVPNAMERESVLLAALRAHGRSPAGTNGTNARVCDIDTQAVAAACNGFTGSEITAIVSDALFAAFDDGAREITTADLIAAARTVVPLTKTAAEKIDALRNWTKGRARPATSETLPTAMQRKPLRALDI